MVTPDMDDLPGPASSASVSVAAGAIGRESALPLRQLGSEEEARMVWKVLEMFEAIQGVAGAQLRQRRRNREGQRRNQCNAYRVHSRVI